ncbi:MAG: DUF433 domain-containing protein [Acidimicrobiia bacterium]|nr:DUF433 domain-containing protein [Acidimicrobiia bacterium]
MEQWQDCEAVERHPDKVSGAWVFRGTRVPLAALFENLRDGASIEEFLSWFPGVQRAQVEAVLEHEALAAAKTIRLRLTTCWGVPWAFNQRSIPPQSVALSVSGGKTIGMPRQ